MPCRSMLTAMENYRSMNSANSPKSLHNDTQAQADPVAQADLTAQKAAPIDNEAQVADAPTETAKADQNVLADPNKQTAFTHKTKLNRLNPKIDNELHRPLGESKRPIRLTQTQSEQQTRDSDPVISGPRCSDFSFCKSTLATYCNTLHQS